MIYPNKSLFKSSRWSGAVALAAGLAVVWLAVGEDTGPSAALDFDQWFAACDGVPTNRKEKLELPTKDQLPLPDFTVFERVLDEFYAHCLGGALANDQHWLGNSPSKDGFFNLEKIPAYEVPFQPFAQRLVVPAGSEVILHGDLHGDVRSLVHTMRGLEGQGYLDGFKLTKPNTYMLFLGDYADRGMYGVEVIYTLMRLKLANPDHVWLVRGNHEDIPMVSRYGFAQEGEHKYGKAFKHRKVTRFYDFLPLVLYLGCENTYAQCNHGGIEPGYRVKALLEADASKQFELFGELKRADYLEAHPDLVGMVDKQSASFLKLLYQNFTPKNATSPAKIGFLWSDFALQAHEKAMRWDDGRPGWVAGRQGTQQFLKYASADQPDGPQVRAIFRAHQHHRGRDPMMSRLIAGGGVFEHWQEADVEGLLDADVSTLQKTLATGEERRVTSGAAYTLNVSPDSVYGLTSDYDFDTCVVLRVAPKIEDWTLRAVNVTVPMEQPQP